MKSLSSKVKWLLACIGLLLALLILKTVLLLTAKPKITVNYVIEYNKITCPTNYDPNDNAASYYEKAFDTFVKMPQELRIPFINWPTDYNSIHQGMLEEWLTSNSQSFEYFRIAADKPYYWLERKAREDNNIFSISTDEFPSLHLLTDAIIWNSKFKACTGQFKLAFEDILKCYRAGRQKCRTPSFVTEQLAGLSFKRIAVLNAFAILDGTSVDNATLKLFQDALHAEFSSDTYIPDMETEKLTLYDAIQRTFVDNGKGTGRLAWRTAWYFDTFCGLWANIKRRFNCFIGPRRNEVIEHIEQLFAISDQLMTKTPWRLRNKEHNYLKKIRRINNSNFFLSVLGMSPERIFHLYHQTRARTGALITTVAILRFKNDKDRFPSELNELVSGGYLQSISMDPYSDGSLIYKVTKNNFQLYSVGTNFSDEGGVENPDYLTMLLPTEKNLPDIIYWPVKRLERPPRQKQKENIEHSPFACKLKISVDENVVYGDDYESERLAKDLEEIGLLEHEEPPDMMKIYPKKKDENKGK